MLVKAGGWLLGGRFLLAGLLLSAAFFFIALIYLYRLVEEDFDARVAGRAVWFISIFPTAFFFQSFYTESLFLLSSIAAFYHARKGNWAMAGLWGLLASLTRVTGILLIIPLLWEYLAQHSFSLRRIQASLLWLALVPCGLLAYMAYLYGDFRKPFLFAQIQVDAWSHKFTPLFSSLERDIHVFFTKTYEAWVVYEIIAVLFLLALTVVGFRYLRGSYSLYMLVSLSFVLTGGSVRSMSRYILVVFPVFILMALFTAGRTARWSVSAVSLGVLGVTTGVFASGRWIA
jgi:Gpi18-like mannosyltransferase